MSVVSYICKQYAFNVNTTVDNVYETLRQRLIEARKAKGLTQEQLAEQTGLDRSHVGYIEQTGEQQRKPTISTLVKLCEVLDIRLEDLFKGL